MVWMDGGRTACDGMDKCTAILKKGVRNKATSGHQCLEGGNVKDIWMECDLLFSMVDGRQNKKKQR